jgi:Calcineurin-like phosphoesterase
MASYDIIGDVHGHASALVALLEKLGYQEHAGAYRHPSRTAVFVGDFIDRGPEQIRTVMIVRRMVDAGSALAVMGNHELNAIAWFQPDPDAPGEFLRPHFSAKYGAKNRKQHARFLVEVGQGTDLHRDIVTWFLSLPLWLDLPELRVVHACWHAPFIEFLAPFLLPGNRIDEVLMIPASHEPADERSKDTPSFSFFKAVEAITKGIEVSLPAGHAFVDKDGIQRRRVRIRWWDAKAVTFREAAMPADGLDPAQLPAEPIPEYARIGYSGKPVFFGHYWLRGAPAPFAANAACLDYSIARGDDSQRTGTMASRRSILASSCRWARATSEDDHARPWR